MVPFYHRLPLKYVRKSFHARKYYFKGLCDLCIKKALLEFDIFFSLTISFFFATGHIVVVIHIHILFRKPRC